MIARPAPESRARLLGGFAILLLGAWILHSYLTLLVWAVVLAIATWPVYERATSRIGTGNSVWAALGLALSIGAAILVPLIYGLGRLLQETQSVGQLLNEAQTEGIAAPDWLASLPWIGNWAAGQWRESLGTAEAARESLHWLGSGAALGYTKAFASQIVHRLFGFFVTLLVLFFLYRGGERLGSQVLDSCRKLFGETGVRYAVHALAAIRATVNGLVLVGLGEGLLLGVGYAVAGLGHPALLGAITGVFALIPFAAKLIFGACSLVLLAQGHMVAGTGLFVFGLVVILLADNYVRPSLIGGAVQLPFL
ncbi:MAG: family transporter, partial [Proteobacteria bacterium]|nr:family transporter [Pseudomonadota bacterium]